MKKQLFILWVFLFTFISVKANDDPPHLPVELIYFKAEVFNNIVLLAWGTATELNNYGFFVERSTTEDFSEFVTLGFVEGHGTSFNTWHYTFEDTTITIAGAYFYRLNQMDIDGNNKYSNVISVIVTSVYEENYKPIAFVLNQNYPNPFNPETNISFSINTDDWVTLVIYDILGNEIETLIDNYLLKGEYNIKFNAEEKTSGIYIYSLRVGNRVISRKMVLQK